MLREGVRYLNTFAQLSVRVSSFHVLCLSSLEGYDQLTDLALEYIVGGNDQSSETGSKISTFELLKDENGLAVQILNKLKFRNNTR